MPARLHRDKIALMNRNVFLWALYDFANTPLTVAMMGLFLAQWVVIDNGLPDIWYGGVFTASTALLLFTSPFWGTWSDKVGKRLPFLKWTTFIFIILGIAAGLIATSSLPKIPRVAIVLAIFFLLQYTYQITLIFYNALMESLAPMNKMGRLAGIGEIFGELGWLLGPAILLPFSTGVITLFGTPGRAQVFLPATFILIVLGLPMIFWLKERKIARKQTHVASGSVLLETFRGIKYLAKHDKNATIFLISFMFVSDALQTANLYFAIFLDQIFKITDVQKFLALALMEISSISTAMLIGKMGDKHGYKKLMVISSGIICVMYFFISLSSSLTFTYILATLVGVGYGGYYITSRALLVKISPPRRLGEYFGFYSTFQKFSSIVGPLTWGAITFWLSNYGVIKYRVASMALMVLMVIGFILATKVKEKKEVAEVL